jgi:N-acetylglucosaminyldiphosphoundecaprenol N-acetyl-beta-D-mannosaminyltransferase
MTQYILGCRLDLIDADQATDRIFAIARASRAAQVVTLGTEMVVYAQRDAEFLRIVNDCELSLCDTIGLLAVARARGATLRARVTGVELIEHLCKRAGLEELSIYLLGGGEGVAADAAAVLEARYPGLPIAGTRSGYFAEEESAAVANEIRASGARVLLAGLGSPRQERWLYAHLRETGCSVGVGVGGSLDVISGRVERAPAVWRRLGLEWLYRLVREPRRWRRQLALPQFIWLMALDYVGLGRKKGTQNT